MYAGCGRCRSLNTSVEGSFLSSCLVLPFQPRRLPVQRRKGIARFGVDVFEEIIVYRLFLGVVLFGGLDLDDFGDRLGQTGSSNGAHALFATEASDS